MALRTTVKADSSSIIIQNTIIKPITLLQLDKVALSSLHLMDPTY